MPKLGEIARIVKMSKEDFKEVAEKAQRCYCGKYSKDKAINDNRCHICGKSEQ